MMPLWLTLVLALGGSSLINWLVVFLMTKISKNAKSKSQDNILIKSGLQALLRSSLYNLNEKCTEKGYATISEKSDFENLYQNYHNLGTNGVMDGVHETFMKLPTHPEEK